MDNPLRPLLAYQQKIFDRFKNSDELGLQMQQRLGKTLVCCHWMKHRGYKNPLIAAPLSARAEWLANIPNANLITYQKISRNPALVDPKKYDCFIIDESSCIKSPRSNCTKAILKQAHRFLGRAILTGILVPEKIQDVYCQLAFLKGGAFMGYGTFWGWQSKFFMQEGYDWHPMLGTLPLIKASVAEAMAILSRKEADVGSIKERKIIEVPMSAGIREVYRTLPTKWRLPNGLETKFAPVAAIWLHRASGGHYKPNVIMECAKYQAVLALAQEHKKLVVWCAYSLEILRLWRFLKEHGIDRTFIQGKTDKDVREKRRQLFFKAKRCVMIAQPTCARFGLDLSAANNAVYLSCPWSYNTRMQSEDRIIHPFKRGKVFIHDIIMREAVDETILTAVLNKQDASRAVIGKGYVQSF